MLQKRERLRAQGFKPWHKRFNDGKFYVEMIFDAAHFVSMLPEAIEAVFYMHEDCTDSLSGPKCEEYARAAHANMLKHFALTADEVPLLRFDPWNLETPFQVE